MNFVFISIFLVLRQLSSIKVKAIVCISAFEQIIHLNLSFCPADISDSALALFFFPADIQNLFLYIPSFDIFWRPYRRHSRA